MWLSAILLLLCSFSVKAIRFASIFQDGMVLQRAPQSAVIFGFDSLQPGAEAFLSCNLKRRERREVQGFQRLPVQSNGEEGEWQVTLPPQPAATTCDITIVGFGEEGEQEVSLAGVIFGDVIICSGQSNMWFSMNNVLNHSEEIAASAGYTDIRFTKINLTASDTELEDSLLNFMWTDPSNSHDLGHASAVCFLYARNLYDMMQDRGWRLPLGLIMSAWGGTRVEAWSTPKGIESCGIDPHVDEEVPQNSNSWLFNGMIAPLRKLPLAGFLWYQGEGNSGYNRDLYNCTFPTLIDSWREEFNQPEAYFGFVQLSTIKFGETLLNYPQLRNHQTADYGTVPNPRMPKTFMAVALDTYDAEHGVHPHYKQIVGRRLATTGMAVAYGDPGYPTQGPIVEDVELLTGGYIRLRYDQAFTYNNSDLSGFFYCCGPQGYCRDVRSGSEWPSLPTSEVLANLETQTITISLHLHQCQEGDQTSIAYLWRQTPMQTPTWAAPIYAADDHRLPSPPSIWPDLL